MSLVNRFGVDDWLRRLAPGVHERTGVTFVRIRRILHAVSVLAHIEVKNTTDAQGNEHDNGNGQFTEKGAGGGGKSTVSKSDDRKTPRNDGKIDFHGNTKAKNIADSQCRKLGYTSVGDMMEKSMSVPKATVDSILNGGNFTCKPHEAVATLRTLSVIKSNVRDGEVKLSERALRHYVCGERRHNGGEPDISRLKSLPQAIDAVKHSDSRHWELDGKPIVVMPGEKPVKGTQAVYCKNQGKTKTYAYADSGVLNGWQVN